ncbi:MAG: hypothetical protein P4L22_03400 [Candidatus Babeliales bacterium]|nr:hypothetical protein [Candidatus Babeliales bacterium]
MKRFLILFLLILSLTPRIYSNDGDLDKTFNNTGKVTLKGKKFSIAYATLVQPDKKVVVTGTVDTKFTVTRLMPNGTLDQSFGTGGVVTLPIINTNGLNEANVLQSNGNIVITGSSNDKFTIVRLKPNGALDTTFGTGGIVQFILGYGTDSNAIALQKNGKIVIGGDSYAGRGLAISRLDANGVLDPSFTDGVSGNGKVLFLFDLNAFGNGVAIQKDGKILLCGVIANFFSIIRLQSNGALDLGFGPFGLGYVPIVSGVAASATSIVVQPNQKILAGGKSDGKFVLARLNSDGSFDTSFNGNGFVQTSIGNAAIINSIMLQPWDGKIVVGGYSVVGTQRFTLARYTPNGKLDTNFGNAGIVITKFGGKHPINEAVQSIAIDVISRKIVAAGYTNARTAIARYIASIPLTVTFPVNGSSVTFPVVITGTADAGSTLKIKIVNVQTGRTLLATVVVDATGNWSYTPATLILGKNILTVTETPAPVKSGKKSDKVFNASIDPTTVTVAFTLLPPASVIPSSLCKTACVKPVKSCC